MSCALRVNTATQVKVSFHLLRRGAAKRGWCCAAPSLFAALSLRVFDSSRSAFCLSRQRHGAGMKQKRLHRHATAVVCGSCATTKKPCRTKPPAPVFSLPHTTLSQSQAWSLRVVSFYPRPPSLSGYGGSHCVARSRLPCHASPPPQVAPLTGQHATVTMNNIP